MRILVNKPKPTIMASTLTKQRVILTDMLTVRMYVPTASNVPNTIAFGLQDANLWIGRALLC